MLSAKDFDNVAKVVETVVELTGISDGARILDVGCGAGDHARQFTEQVNDSEVIGVDKERSHKWKDTERMRFFHVDFNKLDNHAEIRNHIREGSFDMTFTCMMYYQLNYVTHRPFAIERLARLASPGGWVVIIDPVYTLRNQNWDTLSICIHEEVIPLSITFRESEGLMNLGLESSSYPLVEQECGPEIGGVHELLHNRIEQIEEHIMSYLIHEYPLDPSIEEAITTQLSQVDWNKSSTGFVLYLGHKQG